MHGAKKIFMVFILLCILLAACESGNADKSTTDDSIAIVDEASPMADVLDLLPDADFSGAEFVILSIGNDSYWNDVTLDVDSETGDMLFDEIYRRNRTIEEKYNIKIKTIDMSPSDIQSYLARDVAAGDNTYDISQMMLYTAAMCAVEGYLADAAELNNIDLSKPWWDHFPNSCVSIYNKQFILFGDFTIGDKEQAVCIFFNKKMQEAYQMPDFYELTNEGKWTYETMMGFMRAVTEDLNGAGIFDVNSQYGLVVNDHQQNALIYSTGVNIIKKDSSDAPYYGLDDLRFIDAFQKTLEFLHDGNTVANAFALNSHQDDMFAQGTCLFNASVIGSIRTRLRAVEWEFGILPYPKLDENQDKYYSYITYAGPCIVMLNNDSERLERNATILEALNAKSKEGVQVAYKEYALPYKFLRDDESFAMFDTILENRTFEFADIFQWASITGTIQEALKKSDSVIASTIEKYSNNLQTAMEKDLAKIQD